MGNNNITDDGLASLSNAIFKVNMSAIEEISLWENKITDKGLFKFS